jgi:hypothetical protein
MTYHILPRLRPNHTVPNVSDVGTWASSTRQVLEDIYKGLHVDKVESEINSIPDMWARPILFEMALFDRDHVLHDRILGEWRGLLAMIALKEVANLNRLTVAQIKIPELPPLIEGELETHTQQRDFIRTLTKLIPKSTLAADTTWRNLYVFLFGGQPVGITSPTTLVATAADYLNRISNQEVAWYNGTHLKDPVEYLPRRHRQALSGWLEQLIENLDGQANKDQDQWDPVRGLLSEFQTRLGPGVRGFGLSSLGIQGSQAGIFTYLDKSADGDIQEASHVRLIPSEGRSPDRPLIVLDRSIAEQWNLKPQEVTVDGPHTLASTTIEVKNADVWKPATFFTEILFVVFQQDAFLGAASTGSESLTLPGGASTITPILPLNWKLLDHLTATDLAKRVRWSQVPEGLKIELFLNLTGPDAKLSDTNLEGKPGRLIRLSKIYSSKEIQTLDNIPILEIWPDFYADQWKAYFTCYSADDITSTFTVRPFAVGTSVMSDMGLTGHRQRRYWKTETHPEAMICTGTIPNERNNLMETKDAGLLLLKEPGYKANKGLRFLVGIDFGASSTTVCATDSQSPFTVDFADRKTQITASGDLAQARLFDFFLPRKQSEMPVLSFFQDFKNNLDAADLRPFLDGHAYLLETAEFFDPETEGLAFDLKWSREREDRRRARAFLSQICLQTAAELVDKGAATADWAFSYPTAFSGAQIHGFPNLWSQVTEECATQSGLRQNQ